MKPIKLLDVIFRYVVNVYEEVTYKFGFSRNLLILLFCIFNSSISYAQFNENTFEKVIIEIDGETVFNVYAITQDHQGYMWMITNLGLIRYDGIEGKKYFSDTSFKEYNRIHAVYVDSQGDIWIGSRSGLGKYNPDCDCFNHYPSVIDDIKPIKVWAITEDKNKNIWFGMGNAGLFQYKRESDSIARFLLKPSDSLNIFNDHISLLLVDQFNNLWLGTDEGLIRYNIDSENIKEFVHDPLDPNGLSHNQITGLYEDQQGKIFIGTQKSGFHIYNPKTGVLDRIKFDDKNPNQIHASYSEELVQGYEPYVNLIHQDQNGDHWIGTTGKGLNHFITKNKTFHNYDFNLVNPEALYSIYEDRQGNLWVGGGMGSGLFRTDLFAPKYQLNTKLLNATRTYESSANPGVLWVGSHYSGLSKLDLKTNNIIRYLHNDDNIKSIGHNWVRSIYQENKRTLWLGIGNGGAFGGHLGNGGVDRMDIETGLFTHFKLIRNDDGDDDFSYTPFSICEDKEGYLWLGAGPGGIFRSDKKKKEFKHFKIINDANLSKDGFFNIVRLDSNGDIWASDFAGDGTLYLYDRQKEKFGKYLNGFKMYNLLVDDKGWLLISTWEKGLIHLNPADRTYTHYTIKEGLPSNEGVDIVKGENGIYWINTRSGPAKFDARTGEISSIGLPKSRYNTGVFKASNNQIYLGSNNGIYSFNPDEVGGNPYAPQVSISDLLISEKNYLSNKNKSDELNLSYDQNDISIKYVGLHYGNPVKNSYQYKLDPLDDNWINVGSERTVRFANLSPGAYTFHVKASNSNGVWSAESNTVQFTIKPSWWTTWWAYAIYLVILAFLAYKLYRFQFSRRIADSERNRLKELNQLKNNLFTNITHEFRTPLTVIKGMTDALRSDIESMQHDDLENSLEMIERNSDSLLHLVNEMLDLSKIESGNMELQLVQADVIPFIKYLSESFSSLAEENDVNLTIYSGIDALMMDFDSKKLTSVISNLLSNAVKFTPEKGQVIVNINEIKEKDKSYLVIKIKDSGIGISSEDLPHVFNRFYQTDASSVRESEGTGIGLALTKELVELMHGNIEVRSIINIGSEFTLKIPVSKLAPMSKPVQTIKISHANNAVSVSTLMDLNGESDSELPLLLIIEDNTDVAHYLNTCLKNKYSIVHAMNGIEGIEIALEKIPDIIISDVMMPGKDGFEVCATLKSDERTDHIPIIMLTAKTSIKDKLKGLSHGADAYLSKPFNKEELYTRLDQLVTIRRKLISKIQKEGFTSLLKRRTKNPKLQFLQKIEKLIQEDLSNPSFGSKELAKKLLISDSQLYRKIKSITGKSTAVFIRSIRLKLAKELLSTTNKTISEVAYETGFNDPSWFSRTFKDEFGFSPSETNN